MDLYQKVFENNRQWVQKMKGTDPHYFERMAQDQTPEFLYIGCSDSRVPANEIMGLAPGEVFVHRNVANLVVNTDDNVQAVLQYGIEVLKVKHVVVCGHYGCGGVNSSMKSADLGQLNGWLREIRDIYRLHKAELTIIHDEKSRMKRLVELNVLEQCTNIIKTSYLQKSYIKYGYPIVHGWVYDLGEGLIKDLHIDFEKTLEEVREIYDLRKDSTLYASS